MTVGVVAPNPSCLKSIRRLSASLVASDIPTYFASCVLRQTVGLSFTFQLIAAPPRKKTYADVDLRLSNDPPQSESLNAYSSPCPCLSSRLPNPIRMSFVLIRYFAILS